MIIMLGTKEINREDYNIELIKIVELFFRFKKSYQLSGHQRAIFIP